MCCFFGQICDFGLARIIDESKDAPTIDDSSHENGLSDDSGDISTLKSITSLVRLVYIFGEHTAHYYQ